MTLSIQAIDPVSRPFFAGEVSGVDITKPLTASEAAQIEKGMDDYGVLVFHDQKLTDDTQMAFSRNFGELELATNNLRTDKEQRLGAHIADISNLDNDNKVLGRENRRRRSGRCRRTPTAAGSDPSRRCHAAPDMAHR